MNESTVLVVDDETAIRDMLRMALEIAEFRCIEADNIHDAYTQVVDERPDIVLLDWMLPGGSGLEMLRRLKRGDTTRDLPVIMLTAKTAEDNVIQGLDVGADDYITKPFAPRELIARVRALLRRSGGGPPDHSAVLGADPTRAPTALRARAKNNPQAGGGPARWGRAWPVGWACRGTCG